MTLPSISMSFKPSPYTTLLGLIFDKIFGLIYGLIFSYAVISAFIILLERYEFKGLNLWIKNNSIIITNVTNLNNQYKDLVNTI